MSKELEKQANAILRKANFFNDKKKKDTRQTINGRKRRTSRKQKHK